MSSPSRGCVIVTEQPLTYPSNRVVGIVEDVDSLDDVRQALSDVAIDDDQIEVWSGQTTAERIDPDDPSGPVEGVVRTVQKALGEETLRLERLASAIEAGHHVVAVSVPEDDKDTRHAVGNALHEAGATGVAYYGTWAIQELQSGA